MLQDFQFKFIHYFGNRHLNVHALNKTPIKFSKDDEDFGCNVMELEDKLGGTSLPINSNYVNEVVVNLFTLQLIN
jgi:hypothetical protein